MSALSISNHLIMRMLQRQNTKRVIAKRMVLRGDGESVEYNVPSIIIEGGATDIVVDAAHTADATNATDVKKEDTSMNGVDKNGQVIAQVSA
jgi:hypothetical protein